MGKFLALFYILICCKTGTSIADVHLKNSNAIQTSLLAKAEEILNRTPIIDGHNDMPTNFRDLLFNDLRKFNFSLDLTQVEPWASNPFSQTDLPRLRKGRVGGQFWVAYTNCTSNYKDSVPQTLESIDAIKRLTQEYSSDLQYATSASEIENAIANKKIASLIAIEGGHSIQSSPGILRMFYELGVRYMTLAHYCNTPWIDASTVEDETNPIAPANNGISEFGLEIIDEMNRLGMMIDLSHVSQEAVKAVLARSKAPVIFSHSSAKAICFHHRNVPDDILQLVKVNGGLVMINFYRGFIQCDTSKNATVWDVVDHIQHIKETVGVAHVGIGADFDGIHEAPEGLEDVSKYPNLIAALLSTGNWTELELEQLSGRNLLRVFKQVEKIRDSLRTIQPMSTVITREDIDRTNLSTFCITTDFIDDFM